MRINNPPNKVDIKFEGPRGRVLRSLFDKLLCFYAGAKRNALIEVQPNFFADCNTTFENLCLLCSQQELFCSTFGSDGGEPKCLRLLKVLREIVFPDTSEFTGTL